jgi:AraC-like DNA-binding protein
MSQRRFIELFRHEVGMTPKLFCRVERFQGVIRNLERARDVDWVDVALSYGYSDQSHFNHDFREFSGVRPSDYLSLRLSQNHIRHTD